VVEIEGHFASPVFKVVDGENKRRSDAGIAVELTDSCPSMSCPQNQLARYMIAHDEAYTNRLVLGTSAILADYKPPVLSSGRVLR
jgi:hypothetical protein